MTYRTLIVDEVAFRKEIPLFDYPACVKDKYFYFLEEDVKPDNFVIITTEDDVKRYEILATKKTNFLVSAKKLLDIIRESIMKYGSAKLLVDTSSSRVVYDFNAKKERDFWFSTKPGRKIDKGDKVIVTWFENEEQKIGILHNKTGYLSSLAFFKNCGKNLLESEPTEYGSKLIFKVLMKYSGLPEESEVFRLQDYIKPSKPQEAVGIYNFTNLVNKYLPTIVLPENMEPENTEEEYNNNFFITSDAKEVKLSSIMKYVKNGAKLPYFTTRKPVVFDDEEAIKRFPFAVTYFYVEYTYIAISVNRKVPIAGELPFDFLKVKEQFQDIFRFQNIDFKAPVFND